MTDREKGLVEGILVKAISTFHDCDDKEEREKYVREYFLEFCEEYNINHDEAISVIEDFLDDRREKSIFKYENFTDIRSIIFPEEQENENKTPSLDDDER